MKTKKIKTKPSYVKDGFIVGGWLQGKDTYLWIGNQECYIILDKKQLYNLAKNIVREFEQKKEDKI